MSRCKGVLRVLKFTGAVPAKTPCNAQSIITTSLSVLRYFIAHSPTHFNTLLPVSTYFLSSLPGSIFTLELAVADSIAGASRIVASMDSGRTKTIACVLCLLVAHGEFDRCAEKSIATVLGLG